MQMKRRGCAPVKFRKTGSGLDLACGPYFTKPYPRKAQCRREYYSNFAYVGQNAYSSICHLVTGEDFTQIGTGIVVGGGGRGDINFESTMEN